MCIFFRELSNLDANALKDEKHIPTALLKAFYDPEKLEGDKLEQWLRWWKAYTYRCKEENTSISQRQDAMNLINPKYVLRNYMAQLTIDAANDGDYTLIAEMLDMLSHPYQDNSKYDKWYVKRPEWARHKVGCSMLSCSS